MIFAFFLIFSLLLTSCNTTKNQFYKNNETSRISEFDNYSHNTIIVYLENGTSEEEIRALSEKHNLKVLYIYKNFSSCALSSEKTLTDNELNLLIKKIESEPRVLSVQKDYIMSIDSNDF